MHLYDRVADLPLEIDSYRIRQQSRDVSSDFTRTTSVIELSGAGVTAAGEDVIYDVEYHDQLSASDDPFPIRGSYRFDTFSRSLESMSLFPEDKPDRQIYRNFRRWALESAALDLALRQAGDDLAHRLDRSYEPVRFVVSPRLGDPPTVDVIDRWLEIDPKLEFKLDPTSAWSDSVIDHLDEFDRVRIFDLKGQYENADVNQPADPSLYERILTTFPDVVIEDPAVTAETRSMLDTHADRLSWDYPITGIDSLETVPIRPRWVNIKPSRFGSVASVFETIDRCLEDGITMYGGGQFELDVGREHLHTLASLFYPDGPNDVAPRAYNSRPTEGLPRSPLSPPSDPIGLAWSGLS